MEYEFSSAPKPDNLRIDKRLRGDLTEVYKIMRGMDRVNGQGLFPTVGESKTGGHRSLKRQVMAADIQPRLCKLSKKEGESFGFYLRIEKNIEGHLIRSVLTGGPADTVGLRDGDRVIRVNT
eukprot:g29295.t1